jgi:hypothetical protein
MFVLHIVKAEICPNPLRILALKHDWCTDSTAGRQSHLASVAQHFGTRLSLVFSLLLYASHKNILCLLEIAFDQT